MNYLEQALRLIILQYSEKPNASAEMTALLQEYYDLWSFFEEFIPSFDLDLATGDRLDLIGKIVGLSRENNFDLPNDDDDYRFYLRAKITQNNVNARLSGENSLQTAYAYLFDNSVVVIDNKNMTMTLLLHSDVFLEKIHILKQLDLMPTPQGVGISYIVVEEGVPMFGFLGQENIAGFGVGVFAQKHAY